MISLRTHASLRQLNTGLGRLKPKGGRANTKTLTAEQGMGRASRALGFLALWVL